MDKLHNALGNPLSERLTLEGILKLTNDKNDPNRDCVWHDFPEDHEYVWENVQRRRAEGDPLMLGGNFRPFTYKTYHYRNTFLFNKEEDLD